MHAVGSGFVTDANLINIYLHYDYKIYRARCTQWSGFVTDAMLINNYSYYYIIIIGPGARSGQRVRDGQRYQDPHR